MNVDITNFQLPTREEGYMEMIAKYHEDFKEVVALLKHAIGVVEGKQIRFKGQVTAVKYVKGNGDVILVKENNQEITISIEELVKHLGPTKEESDGMDTYHFKCLKGEI